MVPVVGPVGRIGMATGTNLDEETSICIRCEKSTEKKKRAPQRDFSDVNLRNHLRPQRVRLTQQSRRSRYVLGEISSVSSLTEYTTGTVALESRTTPPELLQVPDAPVLPAPVVA